MSSAPNPYGAPNPSSAQNPYPASNPYGAPNPWGAPNPPNAQNPWPAPSNPEPWGGQPSRGQGQLDPRIPRIMGETKSWLNLLGWFFILSGVGYCLTIVGLVIGWLPIWMGLSLTKASKAATNLQQSGSPEEVINYLDGLKVYFTITGIGALIGVIIFAVMFFVGVSTGGLAALSAFSEPAPYRY